MGTCGGMSPPEQEEKGKRTWFGRTGRQTNEPDERKAVPDKRGLFRRLKEGLSRSSTALTQGVATIFAKRKLDDHTLQALEDLLITSDFGVDTASRICARLAEDRFDKEISPDEVRAALADDIAKVLEPVAQPLEIDTRYKPHIVFVVGVNGTGKTTTIGKLALQFRNQGLKVMLAAADTFRAAAIEQLQIWGQRAGVPVVAKDAGADAAGLVYEAIERARNDHMDVLIVDTAGRMQNKAHLMAELEKMGRVAKKLDDDAPHTVLLVLDATTGQNTLGQVEAFNRAAKLTGLIMTKLDGTARGGILVAVTHKFGLPIHAIGVGESIDDLQPFDARAFADILTGAP